MKKFILTVAAVVLVGAGFSAHALEGELDVGRNSTMKTDVTRYSLGTTVSYGLKVSGVVENARDVYDSYGVSVAKSFQVMDKVSLTPKLGVSFVDGKILKDGWVGRYGIGAAYDLTKTTALVTDFTRTFDVKNANQYKGNTITAGVRFAF